MTTMQDFSSLTSMCSVVCMRPDGGGSSGLKCPTNSLEFRFELPISIWTKEAKDHLLDLFPTWVPASEEPKPRGNNVRTQLPRWSSYLVNGGTMTECSCQNDLHIFPTEN